MSFLCSMASRRRRRKKLRQQLLWSRPPRAASPVRRRLFPPAVVTRRKRRASWIQSWNSSRPRSWICLIKSNSVLSETWFLQPSSNQCCTTPAHPNLQSHLSSPPSHPFKPTSNFLEMSNMPWLRLWVKLSDLWWWFILFNTVYRSSFLITCDYNPSLKSMEHLHRDSELLFRGKLMPCFQNVQNLEKTRSHPSATCFVCK